MAEWLIIAMPFSTGPYGQTFFFFFDGPYGQTYKPSYLKE